MMMTQTGKHPSSLECCIPDMAYRTSFGIRFRIPKGCLFRYETLTNRIIPEEDCPKCASRGKGNNSEPDVAVVPLGQIGYGDSLINCLDMSNGGMNSLTLEMTRQCNCRCSYCLYSGAYDNRRTHSDSVMSPQTILRALQFYKRHNGKCKEAHISFYGGEALLEFSAIKSTVSEAKRLFHEKPLSFSISTNGLLLGNDVIKWLADNPNVSVVATVNGPRHDDYRKTREGKATLKTIVKNVARIKDNNLRVWNEQVKFICNIASLTEIRTLRAFYNQVIGKEPIAITGILAQHGNEHIANMIKHGRNSRMRLWRELADEYMNNGDRFLHVLFRNRLRRIEKRPIFKDSAPAVASNCIPFLSNCFISSEGSFNLCEKNAEMCFGNVISGIDKEKVKILMENALTVFNRKCRKCWAQRLCSICFADMDNLMNNNADISEERCKTERENIVSDLSIFTEFTLFHPLLFDKLYGGSQSRES